VGRLEKILEILYRNNINIRSISVAETSDYGIFRLIVDKPKLAAEKLREDGLIVKETEVIALEIADEVGSLYHIVKELSANDILIEYTYSCLPIHRDKVIIVIRVDNNEKAIAVIKNSGRATILDNGF